MPLPHSNQGLPQKQAHFRRSKQKGNETATERLVARREEREQQDRRADQEAVEKRQESQRLALEQEASQRKSKGLNLLPELRVEVDRLEKELANSKDDDQELRRQLDEFRTIIDKASSSALRASLHKFTLRLNLSQADSHYLTQIAQLRKVNESVVNLDAQVKAQEEVNDVLRLQEHGVRSNVADKAVKELNRKLRASKEASERVEGKLTKVEIERDNHKGLIKSSNLKVTQLQGDKNLLECKISNLSSDLDRVKQGEKAELELQFSVSQAEIVKLEAKYDNLKDKRPSSKGPTSDKKTLEKLTPLKKRIWVLEDKAAEGATQLDSVRTSAFGSPKFPTSYSDLRTKIYQYSDFRPSLPEEWSRARTAVTNPSPPQTATQKYHQMKKLAEERTKRAKLEFDGAELQQQMENIKSLLGKASSLKELEAEASHSEEVSSKEKIEKLQKQVAQSSGRDAELEVAGSSSQKKADKALIMKLAAELTQSQETITKLRNENMSLLLQLSGIE